jgi:hypothetical protein
VKRIVLLFVIAIGASIGTSSVAEAQRSGTMQVTARVLDTRESWGGLNFARTVTTDLAKSPTQSQATVETVLANVSVQVARREAAFDRPRIASITINYLRN